MSALNDWSAKQGRVLSGAGRVEQCFPPFDPAELPHHHLLQGDTAEAFAALCRSAPPSPICGAWTRPLFVGGWEHTSDSGPTGERVFNVQSTAVFIDIRIPRQATPLFAGRSALQELSLPELRLFARRHAFAGVSVLAGDPLVATRHHSI